MSKAGTVPSPRPVRKDAQDARFRFDFRGGIPYPSASMETLA